MRETVIKEGAEKRKECGEGETKRYDGQRKRTDTRKDEG